MLKNFRDKIAVSGITVLMVGVALLVFTFISAYGFLTQTLSVIASEDLVATFGQALAPLITTCIHIMYLGVMGWVGSLLTIRGVTIIAHTPPPQPTMIAAQPVVAQANHQVQHKPVPAPARTQAPEKAKPEKPKEEPQPQPQPQTKPYEPEIVVIPPEKQVAPEAQQPSQQSSQQNQQQKNENNSNSAVQTTSA